MRPSRVGAGPPACKLQLRQDLQNPDLFFFEPMDTASAAAAASPGVSGRFFLDPKGMQTAELQDWLRLVKDLHRKGKPILPLFINGLVKNGKSYMLNEVLPAVARTYNGSGGSGGSGGGGGQQHAAVVLPEPNFLRVDCLGCSRSSGVAGFLKAFLIKLKRSAADQQLSAAASTPVPSDCSAGAMAVAIRDFMRRLPRDRLNFLLIDEAQSFYLLERPVSDDRPPRGSTLDVNAVEDMQRILKGLLLDSPHWVAWAVTGSFMAMLSADIAATPTNGFALIMHHRRLNLSPTVSKDVLQDAWEQLKRQAATWSPALPDELLWRSPKQHAMLAFLCQEWRYSRTAGTAVELVEQTLTQKLIPEVQADLRAVLEALGQPADQLLLLHELLDPLAGMEPAKLPPAFKALLASSATEREGRLYLDNLLLAHVLQAVTTESGELSDSMTASVSISSSMFRELAALGECCTDADFDSYKDLHSLLEDMVLVHRCNSRGSKDIFMLDHKEQARQDVKVGLRWFHALQRNVLDYGRISEQQQVLEAYPVKLVPFHTSGRISEVLTKEWTPSRSKLSTPRVQ
ncbi:hypothetical protein TSOC_004558, partial [Tetrabaena socialis]